MATTKTAPSILDGVDPVDKAETAPSIQELWSTAEVLDGVDPLDKAELIGVKFLITAIRFTTNVRGIEYAYVEGVKVSGEKFEFQDSSSTGVRQQLLDHLVKNGRTDGLKLQGEIFDVAIIVPKGLRVSIYDVEIAGKERRAKTYYLTLSGKRSA